MIYKAVLILFFSFFSLGSWWNLLRSYENSSWFWSGPDFSSSCMAHVMLILKFYVTIPPTLTTTSTLFVTHTSVCWDLAASWIKPSLVFQKLLSLYIYKGSRFTLSTKTSSTMFSEMIALSSPLQNECHSLPWEWLLSQCYGFAF